jgi:hypothetical protein
MPVNTAIIATGQNVLEDGSLWYQLDKQTALPSTTALQVWVLASDVNSLGRCDLVKTVGEPRIIRQRRQQ